VPLKAWADVAYAPGAFGRVCFSFLCSKHLPAFVASPAHGLQLPRTPCCRRLSCTLFPTAQAATSLEGMAGANLPSVYATCPHIVAFSPFLYLLMRTWQPFHALRGQLRLSISSGTGTLLPLLSPLYAAAAAWQTSLCSSYRIGTAEGHDGIRRGVMDGRRESGRGRSAASGLSGCWHCQAYRMPAVFLMQPLDRRITIFYRRTHFAGLLLLS